MIVHNNCQLAYGVTRTVWLIGKYALKFPRLSEWRLFLLGLLANMQEALFSGTWPELCPVIWSLPGGFLVVMKRAESISDEDFDNLDKARFKDLPVEMKSDSFGLLNGKVVIVDYGN